MPDQDPVEVAALLNQNRDGWSATMGLSFVRASRDEVVADLEVGPANLQAYGIVHGGVHAGVIETLASVGAALDAMTRAQSVVGLENHTSFLRAVRGGRLRVTAKPLSRGRRSQVWEGTVIDDRDRVVATGRVRLFCLDAGVELAGEQVALKKGELG